jgi:hypothetical protein
MSKPKWYQVKAKVIEAGILAKGTLEHCERIIKEHYSVQSELLYIEECEYDGNVFPTQEKEK